MCQSLHQGSSHSNQSYVGRDYNCLSSSPSWPNQNRNSLIFADSGKISFANYPANQKAPSSLPRFRRQQSCHIEFSFGNRTSKNQTMEPKLDSLKGIDDKEVKITLALGNSTYKSDNDKLDLGEIFQENVPWQSENIPLILEALDQDKVVLIQGNDSVAKRRLAVGIAKSMFGSSDLLFHVGMRKKVNTAAHNREMLEKALRDHEKIVVLVEDVDHADPEFVEFLVGGYENGTFNNGHATFVLTTGGDHNTRCNKGKENMDYVIQMKLIVGDSNLDHKRKADDWDLPNRSKSPRNTINEIEEVISSNALDLNIKADDDDDDHDREDKQGELNRPVIPNKEQHSTSLGFLEKIKNRFVLNRNTDQEKRTRDMFLSKLKRSFEEVSGIASSFSVEERVLEDILQGSGLYLNNLFEQWLKQVFQTSLRVVDGGEWEKVCSIRLCLGEKSESTCQEDDGFMGTCLPKRIQVCLTG